MDEKVAPLLLCCPQWTTDKEKLANRESRVSPVSKAVHLADWNKAEENKGRWAEMEELSEEVPSLLPGPSGGGGEVCKQAASRIQTRFPVDVAGTISKPLARSLAPSARATVRLRGRQPSARGPL